jgi:pimeloyl-[acyl-carrier protein] synthase
MPETVGPRPRTISSVFRNLEHVVRERAPHSSQALLGARWSFALPQAAVRQELTEYTLPLGPVRFPEKVLERTGLRILEHHGDAPVSLHHHLSTGEPAVVVVDSFFLPYRPAFGRVHSSRTIVVRRGRHIGEAWVDDPWGPTYKGPIPMVELGRARHSPVPLQRNLEPIFAGRPTGGEWLSVDVTPMHVADPAAWGANLLWDLHHEATTATADGTGEYGIGALHQLQREFELALAGEAAEYLDWARQVSLLLRVELSSRVFLCALLRAVAVWTKDVRLREEVATYYADLRAMEMSRDILTKSLRRPRPGYLSCASDWLAAATVAEERLAAFLDTYPTPPIWSARWLPPTRDNWNSKRRSLMATNVHSRGINLDEYDPYGLVSQEIFHNPHPVYHMLRYSEPVHWSTVLNAWVLTSYEDVVAALRDQRLSNALRRSVGTAHLSPDLRVKMAPIDHFLSLWVLNLDDPEHHRLRVLLSQGFTPRAMDRMRSRIHQIAEGLLDAFPISGSVDFVAQYARPLPVQVIAEMFGVPEDGRRLLSDWSHHISRFFELGPARVEILDNMNRSVLEMTDYLRVVVDENRKRPRDNILGNLIRAQQHGQMLDDDQLLSTCMMLLFAGHDSTVNLIGSGMLALLQHPDQLARLQADPGLINTAVQEFLRYESPVMRHDRVAREDFDLHGHTIRRGQRVILGLGAANRDPARFANPDVLDITRKGANKHTTFGGGPHSCLGAALAVAQAGTAINLVLDRFPGIRLSSEPYHWREHFNFRGLRALPVQM